MRLVLCTLVFCVLTSLLCGQSSHDARSSETTGSSPVVFLDGDILQGPAPHFGLYPLGICLDVAGVVHSVPTLYVADLYDGLTFLYDATDLTLLETIPSPAGVSVVSGITTDGVFLYCVADETLYRTAMDGTGLVTLGPLALPGGGLAGDACLDDNGDLWVVDITADQYSRHSTADGAYLGDVFPSPSGIDAFGTGIAFRSDCNFFEVPHGALTAGQVTTLSVTTNAGLPLDSTSVAPLGAFVSGVATATPSPTFGVYSLFVVEAATGSLLEVEGLDPCPVPQTDCHANPSESAIFSYSAPAATFPATPGLLVSSVLPTTFSTMTLTGVSAAIEDVDCLVDISHTFVGDLDVTLESPTGISIQLHDSAGTSANDLIATFDQDGRPNGAPFGVGDTMRPSGPGALSDYVGTDGNGIWTLAVTDNFDGEDGTLNSWELRTPSGLPIPDDNPSGIVATLTVDSLDSIADLDASLDLIHADPSQLRVELTSPSGTTVVLHDQSGSGTDLVERYDDDPLLGGANDGFGTTFPAGPGTLADFDGEPVAGDWTLTVQDLAPGEEGSLRGWDLLVCPAACAPPFGLTCDSDCQTGDVTLTWLNPVTYTTIDVLRDGIVIATLPGDATTHVDTVASGLYQYELVGSCDPGATSTTCSTIHAPYSGETHLIYAGERPAGAIDSVGAVRAALQANGESPLVITDLTSDCYQGFPTTGVVWVLLGTFPDSRVLTVDEGQQLADWAAAGAAVYIEGADVWGFDDPTPFAQYDGIEDTTALDGDDSFENMIGLAHADLDLSDLTAAYQQDQLTSSDFTDQLLPTGATPGQTTDLPAGSAGLIWQDETALYGTGVYFQAADPNGRVIAQSWEFGGYAGDSDDLAARYLNVLAPVDPSAQFRRGDANDDGSVQISDAVFLLSYLFIPGSDDPPCFSAADPNDDGSVQISDAVYLLSYLFVPSSPPPPAPFPDCGVEGTPDGLLCDLSGC